MLSGGRAPTVNDERKGFKLSDLKAVRIKQCLNWGPVMPWRESKQWGLEMLS